MNTCFSNGKLASSPNKTLERADEQSAFTLTDLLATLAALAVLAVVVFPAFGRTRNSSGDAVCKNNVRQLTLGCFLYADESRGYMPWAPMGGNSGTRGSGETLVFAVGGPEARLDAFTVQTDAQWASHLNDDTWGIHAEVGAVFPYVTGRKRSTQYNVTIKTKYEAYRCPSAGIKGEVLRVNYSENKYYSSWAIYPDPTFAGIKVEAIVRPSVKGLIVEETAQSMKDCGFTPGGTSSQAVGAGALLNHDGQGNISYSDGHIETVTMEKYKKMIGMFPDFTVDQAINLWWDPRKSGF